MEIKILHGANFPHQQVLRLLWFRGVNRYVYKMRSSKSVEVWPSVAAEVWLRAQSPQGLSVQNQDSQSFCPFTGQHWGGCMDLISGWSRDQLVMCQLLVPCKSPAGGTHVLLLAVWESWASGESLKAEALYNSMNTLWFHPQPGEHSFPHINQKTPIYAPPALQKLSNTNP